MASVAHTIQEKLQARFSPERLEVIDDSAKHAGHSGARSGGESHFTVKITASAFEGVNRVQRQRQIHAALAISDRAWTGPAFNSPPLLPAAG